MLKELTKETLKESVKTVMADGFKTASAGVYAGFICAGAWTGVQLGYTGWKSIYAKLGKIMKELPAKLKKQKPAASDGNEKPEEPKQE